MAEPDGPHVAESSGRPHLIDARALLAACEDDAAILDRVVHVLRVQVPIELAQAEEIWRREDAKGLRDAAHKMHGMIAAVSSLSGALASELEDEAAAGRLREAGLLLERLGPMTREVLTDLDGISIERLRGMLTESDGR